MDKQEFREFGNKERVPFKEQECPICGDMIYPGDNIECPICDTIVHIGCLITCDADGCEVIGCEECFTRGQTFFNLDSLYCGEICEEIDRKIAEIDQKY